MRQKFFMFTIAVVAMLTSCNRHESLLTGGYGERVVAGQVVMASEMADSSPAGVEVSVVGTGMSAILAADGRFTFAGVPADAELAFRRADGVDARIRVASPAPLVVELAGKTATSNGSHRRGVSPKDPGPSQQIEGVIQTPGTDSIIVLDSHQHLVTIALDRSTLIRKGNETVKAADLKKGDRVHVKAVMKDNKLTALQVIVQETEGDDDSNHDQQVEGLIVTVSPTSITVHDSHGQDVVMVIKSSTIIRKGNQTVPVADLKKDDRVHVHAAMVDGKLTALEIIVQQQSDDHGNDQEMEVEGAATVSGSSLVVRGITVNTDANTIIKKQGQRITVIDINSGDAVEAHERADDTNALDISSANAQTLLATASIHDAPADAPESGLVIERAQTAARDLHRGLRRTSGLQSGRSGHHAPGPGHRGSSRRVLVRRAER